jgi:hypothetical protein
MVSVESTAAQAASAFAHGQGPITASPSLLNLTAFKTAAADVTSSFTLPSAEQILRFPLRFASLIDRAVLFIWHQVFVESLGINIFTTGGQPLAQGVAGAQAMAEAAAQPAVAQAVGGAAAESWAAFFAEAFQASTFKSYWGMLHYLTSRWAFTCFAMVRKTLRLPRLIG